MRVALVLDVTGSMASDGKMPAMQNAAKDLVDQLSKLAAVNGDIYISVVPFSKEGVLAIRSYRHLVDSYQVEVPSGYIDDGETPRQAALRELEEETGYVAKRLVRVGSYTLDYSMFIQRGHIFAAYGLEEAGRQSLGDMEKISKIEFVPVRKMKRMLRDGRITNAASIVALYRALHHRTGSLT